MTGTEFAQLQEALMYVFYPVVSWFLAFVMLSGFVAGLLVFFQDFATPQKTDD